MISAARVVSKVMWAVGVILLPAVASAQQPDQSTRTVRGIVDFLVTNQAVQTGDLERDRAAAEAARAAIARSLLVNVASVPLASSSSGFVYRLNPQLGTVERATQNFGSFFVERALTSGAGRASFGASAFITSFDRLGDLRLRDGSLVTVANQFRDESAPYNTEGLTLRLRTSTLTFFGSVGITDAFEIGAALPVIHLSLEGERLNVYRGNPFLQASAEASASGIGDAAIRGKYTLVRGDQGAFAAAAEVRLPTGDDENLLGAGATAIRLLAIGSFERGPFTLYGNGGVVRGGISDEVLLSGATAFAVAPRVTLSAEVLMRHVADLNDLSLVSAAHPTVAGADTLRLASGEGGTTLMNAVTGFKWNVSDTFVLGGHVAFPLARRGLTSPITPTLALEYSF